MRRAVPLLFLLVLLAAACSGGDEATRETTGPSEGPDTGLMTAEGDSSSTSGGETTTSQGDTTTTGAETTTTGPPPACALPRPLPELGSSAAPFMPLHQLVTDFAVSVNLLGDALEAATDFSPGWGAREPVASAFYRMQADLYTLALNIERTYRGDGATYAPGAGWRFPIDPYPLAALAGPWEEIPTFQAVTLTGFFEMATRRDALAFFEGGGVCALATAFSEAMDQAVEDGTA